MSTDPSSATCLRLLLPMPGPGVREVDSTTLPNQQPLSLWLQPRRGTVTQVLPSLGVSLRH